MQKNFFRGKRILITGITGFVGSHLSQRLQSLGAEVYGFSRSSSDKNIARVNILHLPKVEEFLKAKKIAICFHLAGESLVERGQENPHYTFKVNIQGTLNILEATRRNSIERVIVASTSHVYGSGDLPFTEDDIPRPSRPYETSKTCTDLIAQSYAASFQLPILIPRFVNIYGPYDLNFSRIIPQTIRSIIFSKTPMLWGGGIIRDYLYIDDAVDAYLSLAAMKSEKIKRNRIYNFGGGNPISVVDLMQKLIMISGKELSIEKTASIRPFEIGVQYVSFAKAKRDLQWEPKHSLDKGLRETYLWYKAFFKKSKRISALF